MQSHYGREELCRHLRDHCQLRCGDTLVVHSSLKSIGWVEGGAAAVVEALKSSVGDSGTLLMPTFTDPQPDGFFYMDQTPSRTGMISEVFRKSAGVVRSRHPTHSVAVWGRRLELVSDHDRTAPLGVDSPFHRAAKVGAKVLLIGVEMNRCSLVHVAEAIMDVPYLGKAVYADYERNLVLVDGDGTVHPYLPRDVPGDSAAFDKVQRRMEGLNPIHHGRLGDANCLLFYGETVLKEAVAMLREDPVSLLCENPRCLVCQRARTFCTTSARS